MAGAVGLFRQAKERWEKEQEWPEAAAAQTPIAAAPLPPAHTPAAADDDALHERMGGLRISTVGGTGCGPSSSRASAAAEPGSMANSRQAKLARLANLQASRRGSRTPSAVAATPFGDSNANCTRADTARQRAKQ